MLSTRNVLVAVTLLVLLGLITLTPSQPLTLVSASSLPQIPPRHGQVGHLYTIQRCGEVYRVGSGVTELSE